MRYNYNTVDLLENFLQNTHNIHFIAGPSGLNILLNTRLTWWFRLILSPVIQLFLQAIHYLNHWCFRPMSPYALTSPLRVSRVFCGCFRMKNWSNEKWLLKNHSFHMLPTQSCSYYVVRKLPTCAMTSSRELSIMSCARMLIFYGVIPWQPIHVKSDYQI